MPLAKSSLASWLAGSNLFFAGYILSLFYRVRPYILEGSEPLLLTYGLYIVQILGGCACVLFLFKSQTNLLKKCVYLFSMVQIVALIITPFLIAVSVWSPS